MTSTAANRTVPPTAQMSAMLNTANQLTSMKSTTSEEPVAQVAKCPCQNHREQARSLERGLAKRESSEVGADRYDNGADHLAILSAHRE